MRASTSRFVYCLGLLAVTACAVLREALPGSMAASHTEAKPLTTEMRLAQAIRGRVELAANVPLEDPSMVEAIATHPGPGGEASCVRCHPSVGHREFGGVGSSAGASGH